MVLQRGMSVPVWGWADPGEEVTLEFAGQRHTATANSLGHWHVRLKPLRADSEGRELQVGGKNSLTIGDVLVGEVWVCSGQSNMWWPVRAAADAEKEIAAADHSLLRMFTARQATADAPQTDCEGAWQVCSPATVPDFSAVGYYFARELLEELHVPIGMIHTSWGGTPAEAWTKLDALQGDALYQAILQRRDDAGTPPQHRAASLYNAMIAPLIPYGIKGAIWYQGESNVGRAWQYRKLFPTMIRCWRSEWKEGDFPFYFVQLAPYFYGGDRREPCAELWEAQSMALKLPKTGMAVTMDIGDVKDIHPKNKQEVGWRLALWALAKDYGKKLAYSGPLYKSMKVEGSAVRIRFDYPGSGLMTLDGKEPSYFQIAGSDREFVPARARIEKDTVVVWADGVKDPVAVRYAWRDDATPNLVNKEKLPASPFRTDDWPAVTRDNR
jgi:sialate O-acetylesterase